VSPQSGADDESGHTQEYQDILYTENDGVAWVTINRHRCSMPSDPSRSTDACGLWGRLARGTIGVVVLSGTEAFLYEGRSEIRGEGGYNDASGMPRLHVQNSTV
jgi:hypothetical protein